MTDSNAITFGLCDGTGVPYNYAYIDISNQARWIATVNNPNSNQAEFYAIDKCLNLRNPNGTLQSSCDGMLLVKNKLIFVELKEAKYQWWLAKGMSQLSATILAFINNQSGSITLQVSAYVCNNLRPRANTGYATLQQQFKDGTGCILYVQSTINI